MQDHIPRVNPPPRKPDASMNIVENDEVEDSWHSHMQNRCDLVLNGLSQVVGSLSKQRRSARSQAVSAVSLSIFHETVRQSRDRELGERC